MTNHPTREQIERYSHRTLPPFELLEVDDHLAGCTDCRNLAASLAPMHELYASLRHGLAEDIATSPELELAAHGSRKQRQRWFVRLDGVLVQPGDSVGVEVVGRSQFGNLPYIRTGATRVLSGSHIRVTKPDSRYGRLTVVTRDRGTGDFQVLGADVGENQPPGGFAVGPVEKNEWGHDRLQRIFEASSSSPMLQSALGLLHSLVFFDDVKVYAGDKMFLDETFDDYPVGAYILKTKGLRGLSELWSGKAAYVTHDLHAPGSGPGCWANEAFPNWNRQDVIEITPDEVPPGVPLTYEAAVYMTDLRMGATIGFSRPYVRVDGQHHQLHYALMRLTPQGISVSDHLIEAPLKPFQWHRIRVGCDLDTGTIGIVFDGRSLASGLPFKVHRQDLPFTHFVIGGSNFRDVEG